MIDPVLYSRRRVRLATLMQDGVAIVRTAPERLRNRDSSYPFRFDSYFHYLTGFPEPEAVLVLFAGKATKSILFCREKDIEREIWDGFRYGPEKAQQAFGLDEAHPIAKLDELLPQLLANQPAVFCDVGADPDWDRRVIGWINSVRAQVRTGVSAPGEIRDVRRFLDDMRLIKDEHEIGTMRRAADISSQAHRRAMRTARPGLHEYELEAELIHEFRRQGAQAPAYTPIVAGGANSCVLHYVQNDAPLKDGDVVLIDAGCELDGYASDITAHLSGERQVLRAATRHLPARAVGPGGGHRAGKAGQRWEAPHDAAVKVLAQGMVDLGLCKGSADGVIESGDYRALLHAPHRTLAGHGCP